MSAVAAESSCWVELLIFRLSLSRRSRNRRAISWKTSGWKLRAQLQSVCKPPSKDSQTSEQNTKEEEDRDIGKGASASDDDHIDSQPFERGAASNLQIPHLGRIEDCNASLHVQDWQSILSLNVDFYEKALEGCWLLFSTAVGQVQDAALHRDAWPTWSVRHHHHRHHNLISGIYNIINLNDYRRDKAQFAMLLGVHLNI